MNIAMVMSSLDIGGTQCVVSLLARELAEKGHKVLIFALRKSEDGNCGKHRFGPYWSSPNISVIETEETSLKSPSSFLRSGKALRKALSEFGPDIIHSHSEASDLIVSLFIKGHAIPRVRTSHIEHYLRDYAGPFGVMLEHVMNRLGGYSAVVAISKRIFARNRKSANTVLIYNGIFDLRNPPARYHPKRDNKLRAVVIGTFHRRKGQKTFIDALCRRYPNPKDLKFNLRLYGCGPDREALLDAVRQHAECIQVNGPQVNPDDIYADNDVVLIPSLREGLSTVMMEAVGHGLAVLSLPVSGAEDVLSRWRCGQIAANHSEMLTMLERRVWPEVSESDRLDILDTFSSSRSARRHEELYEELLAVSRMGPLRTTAAA